MGRPHRDQAAGLTHHIYCRGNRGSPVFEDDDDRADFLEKMFELARELQVAILAYCLMSNHFHLCIRTSEGGGTLSKFMQRLNLWHARRYNRRHGVSGRLNESRFKSKKIDSDSYLITLIRYIHQNPVRAGLASTVAATKFTSHAAYLRQDDPRVETSTVLRLLGGVEAYRALVEERQPSQEGFEQCRFKRCKPLKTINLEKRIAGTPDQERPRLQQAYELAKRGRSLREIGSALGCHKSTIGRWMGATTCREAEVVYLCSARAA